MERVIMQWRSVWSLASRTYNDKCVHDSLATEHADTGLERSSALGILNVVGFKHWYSACALKQLYSLLLKIVNRISVRYYSATYPPLIRPQTIVAGLILYRCLFFLSHYQTSHPSDRRVHPRQKHIRGLVLGLSQKITPIFHLPLS